MISLCVEDTGIGIEPESQTRIFEHFSQADAPPPASLAAPVSAGDL